jgi:hypothetical protein
MLVQISTPIDRDLCNLFRREHHIHAGRTQSGLQRLYFISDRARFLLIPVVAWQEALPHRNMMGESGYHLTDEHSVLLEHVLSNSLNEINIFDAVTLRFVLVNQSARKNLGYSMAELCQLTPLNLEPENSLESFSKMINPLHVGEQKKASYETVHFERTERDILLRHIFSLQPL